MVFAIYSHPEHPHTKRNEPKCIRCGRIGPRLCESVDQERIRGMPYFCGKEAGARTATEAAKT